MTRSVTRNKITCSNNTDSVMAKGKLYELSLLKGTFETSETLRSESLPEILRMSFWRLSYERGHGTHKSWLSMIGVVSSFMCW